MKQSQQSGKKKSSVQVEKIAPCQNQNSESDENHGEELGDEFPVKVHYQHILKQQKEHYTVEQRLLFQCGITKLNRLKLQVWLSEECEKGCFLRETFATINKYLELYMTKCEKLPITTFQLLGLACFRVAAKVVESRSPPISYHSFDPTQILAFQKQLCFMLGFRIQPFTYVSAADLIFLNWQNYQQIYDEQKQISFLDNRAESLVRNHAMMEILDCLSLIPEFSEINIYSLVLCMFFFVHRFYLLKEPYPTTQKEVEICSPVGDLNVYFSKQLS